MLRTQLSLSHDSPLVDRLAAVWRDRSRGEGTDAPGEHVEVSQRIESQLAGYHSEIERLCGRLDAVAEEHLAGSGGPVDEAGLVAQLRALRDEMSALAAGVEHAYAEAPS
jgi:hypothetical protein